MDSIEGFSQKKGKAFLGAGVPRQRSVEEAESVSAGAIKYCKSREKNEKRTWLDKNLILLLLGITGPLGQQQLEISTTATTCTES